MSDIASLVTLRSILDIEIARSYQWDAATIIKVSGVDRAGDLTTRIVENVMNSDPFHKKNAYKQGADHD